MVMPVGAVEDMIYYIYEKRTPDQIERRPILEEIHAAADLEEGQVRVGGDVGGRPMHRLSKRPRQRRCRVGEATRFHGLPICTLTSSAKPAPERRGSPDRGTETPTSALGPLTRADVSRSAVA